MWQLFGAKTETRAEDKTNRRRPEGGDGRLITRGKKSTRIVWRVGGANHFAGNPRVLYTWIMCMSELTAPRADIDNINVTRVDGRIVVIQYVCRLLWQYFLQKSYPGDGERHFRSSEGSWCTISLKYCCLLTPRKNKARYCYLRTQFQIREYW